MSLNQSCGPGRLQYHSAAAGGSTHGVWSLGNFWRSLSLRFCKNKQGHILPYTLLSFSSFIFLLLNSPQIWNQRWSASARLCHSRTDSSVTGTLQGHIIQIWTHLFIIIILLSLFLIRFFSVFQEIPILPHVWTWCSPQTILWMWNI